jgi:hypothetical protein
LASAGSVFTPQSYVFRGAGSQGGSFAHVPGTRNAGFSNNILNSSGLLVTRPIYNIQVAENGISGSNGTEWRMRRLERELSFDQDQVLLMKKKVCYMKSIDNTASIHDRSTSF